MTSTRVVAVLVLFGARGCTCSPRTFLPRTFCSLARRKANQRHRGLKQLAKLGRRAEAEQRKEQAKMDALLASVGLSREKLADSPVAIPSRNTKS